MIYAYGGRASQAVRRLKFERATALAAPMAADIARAFNRLPAEWDVIVPVPIHPIRRRQRGFNQAELLCESLPPNLVQTRFLRRTRHTRPQVGLPAAERLINLKGAFTAAPSVHGLKVLLVDDVVTTGGTIVHCAEALTAAGAERVGVLAFLGNSNLPGNDG
jgi:ComF family protein